MFDRARVGLQARERCHFACGQNAVEHRELGEPTARETLVAVAPGELERANGCFSTGSGVRPERARPVLEHARPIVVHTRSTEQDHVVVGMRALPALDPDRYAFTVLNQALGGGMSSLVFQEIREARGLAYSAVSVFSPGTRPRDASGLLGFLSTQADKTPEALATLIDLCGAPEDEPLARMGYYVAFVALLPCPLLLIADLNRPERFWHMLFASETLRPIIKWWSPMSVGAWALLVFGFFSFLSFLAVLIEDGRLRRWPALARLRPPGILGAIVVVLGGVLGLFIAGYTGILLAVTNRPIWADTHLLGLLFVGLSLNLARILADRLRPVLLPVRAEIALIVLVPQLVVGSIALVPDQPRAAMAAEVRPGVARHHRDERPPDPRRERTGHPSPRLAEHGAPAARGPALLRRRAPPPRGRGGRAARLAFGTILCLI